jgi:hypothetical protein
MVRLALLLLVFCGTLAATAFAAPDNTLGTALLGAIIDGDGTIEQSSGLVSITKAGTGLYDLTFNRDVSICFGSVTPVFNGITTAIFINPGQSLMRVYTRQTNGSSVDSNFHILFFCPR